MSKRHIKGYASPKSDKDKQEEEDARAVADFYLRLIRSVNREPTDLQRRLHEVCASLPHYDKDTPHIPEPEDYPP